MACWRVALLLVSGVLPGCGAEPPDLRSPAEIAAPSPDAWRAAARDLAAAIAERRPAAETSEPAVLDPVEGSAPPYFRDLLLADLIGNGIKIAQTGDWPLHLACRASEIGVLPATRGLTREPAALPSGEVLVLCLLARDGAYVASARHSLTVPAAALAPGGGTVIEVKG